jgi:fructokinase
VEGGALVLGEALVDVVRQADGSSTEHPGGSPANVAVALARLGRPTSLATDISDDRLGRSVLAHLDASGVGLALPVRVGGATSSAVVDIGADGAAVYDFDLRFDIEVPRPARPPVVVHTGSIGAVLAPGADVVREVLVDRRTTSTVTYDLNIRRQVMGSLWSLRAKVEALLALSDVVKAADEDLAALYPELGTDAAARRLLELGPAAVLVTRGGGAVTAMLASGQQVAHTVRKVAVADTIGAGDSFTAAVIDRLWSAGLLGVDQRDALRLLDREGWLDVLRYGAAAAAIAVSRPGADPAWRHELDARAAAPSTR